MAPRVLFCVLKPILAALACLHWLMARLLLWLFLLPWLLFWGACLGSEVLWGP